MKPTPPAPGAGRIAVGWSRRAPAGRSRWPRRLAAAVVTIVALLGIAWGGYWLVLTNRLEAEVRAWISERRAQGYDVGYAAIQRAGFPRSAHVVVTNPAMAMPANAAPLAWSATRLVAGVDPFNPRQLSIDVPGAHALSIGEGPGQVRYEAEARQFRVMGEGGRATPTASVRVRDLVLRSVPGESAAPVSGLDTGAIGGPPSEDAVTIARLDATGRPVSRDDGDNISASYHFILNAGDAVLPRWLDLPLGHDVARVVLDATVQGELTHGPWPKMLLHWRDAGGIVEVAALEAEYGPLTLTGSGTLALDKAGQPVGAFATRTSGIFGVIDTLRANGYMKQGDALVAKLAISVLAGTPDRQAPLALPLTLQDRTLSIGPVTLMKVPEIDWLSGSKSLGSRP